jgi:hypothetical protein
LIPANGPDTFPSEAVVVSDDDYDTRALGPEFVAELARAINKHSELLNICPFATVLEFEREPLRACPREHRRDYGKRAPGH